MQRFKISALLLAASVLTLAAVGNSSPYTSGNVTLMDFETQTGTLLGYPNGTPPLGWYLRTQKTAELFAVIPPTTPPGPCRSLGIVWNIIITKFPDGPQRTNALTAILRTMARHDCRANLTRDETSSPAPVISIAPTP